MASPTSRSLEHCRDRGLIAQVVEKWIPQSGRRLDLFGCIDIIALDDCLGCLGIQATSGSNVASRADKAKAEPRLRKWLKRGNRFEVWGWRKVAAYRKDGTRAKRDRWDLRRVPVTLDDLAE